MSAGQSDLSNPSARLPSQVTLVYVISGLNKNVPQSLRHMNTWPSLGATAWENLGGVVLLGMGFESLSLVPLAFCAYSVSCS